MNEYKKSNDYNTIRPSIINSRHFNRDVFKTNNDNEVLHCDYCGEMIRKGKLSICKFDKSQIHIEHVKKIT